MVDVVTEKTFPAAHLVPTVETRCAAFLAKYPDYNGDGVTIAIFDSGVDPRSEGMQTTPDGTTKVIERFDCTGSGDVDMSRVVHATPESTIQGVSGRYLRLTEQMISENTVEGEYRIGLKGLYDLYPTTVRDRLLSDHKQQTWSGAQKTAIAEVSRSIEQMEIKNASNAQNLSSLERLAKENLDQSLESLNAWDKFFGTLRPLYDVVLWRTSKGWRVAIDVSETGNMDQALILDEYSVTHEVKSIADHLSVSMNVHDNGNVVEIVGMCSSHGTHVASIASGNHTNDPDLNGTAPGAKIVSLTIGDTRLGTMETGTAIVRAMIKVMELCDAGRRVHVINMSYGEHAHFSSSGRLGQLMAEMVYKYNIVWVVSAGNHGPALCTVGTPPDTAQALFVGVGAYVSSEMIEAEYALRNKLPATCYTWTSRDPCIDGGQGVTVCAPGAAVASVPEFTRSKQQLMHGTSMAAPHVAGAVAILISGLLKQNVKYSTFGVKRALWNTATRLSNIDPFAQGNGLLNVERAFEALSTVHPDTMIAYSLKVEQWGKGIHIRMANPVAKEYTVSVEPVFVDEKNVAPQQKIEFNVRLTLVASEPWVKVATFLDLSYCLRLFSVTVDPTGLQPGVHSARINAYDTADLSRGTLFEVPITVVQPHRIDPTVSNVFTMPTKTYKGSELTRTFIQVPAKCTWAVLRLRSPNSTQSLPARFYVHTMQIVPQRNCKECETQKLFSVGQEVTTVHAFRCVENNVLEVCIAKFWSTVGEAQLEATIEFRGISSGAPGIVHVMRGPAGIHRIDLTSLSSEEVQPAVQLTTAVMVLRPGESKITPLGVRDCWTQGRQIYQNQLSYALQLFKPQELSLHMPLLNDVLYESEFESQLWQLFDTNKLMVASGDANSADAMFKLEKGEYVLRLQVRHERRDLLEKVAEATMLATFKLASPISMDVCVSYRNAVHATKRFHVVTIARNTVRPIYLVPLTAEKITKANIPSQCSWLNGTLSLSKDELGRKLEVDNIRYMLTEGPAPKKPNGSPGGSGSTAATANGKDPARSKFDEYREGLRDFKVNQMQKLDLADAETLYAEVVDAFPDHLPAHTAMMQKLDPATEQRSQMPFIFASILEKNPDTADQINHKQQQIIDLANKVIAGTDVAALLVHMGTKVDNRPDAAKIKGIMEKQRCTLVDALVRKAVAIGKQRVLAQRSSAEDTELLEDMLHRIHELYLEAGKFADYSDSKLSPMLLWHSYHHQHHGRHIKLLQKLYEDKLQAVYLEEIHYAVTDRKWDHVPVLIKRIATAANPMMYRNF